MYVFTLFNQQNLGSVPNLWEVCLSNMLNLDRRMWQAAGGSISYIHIPIYHIIYVKSTTKDVSSRQQAGTYHISLYIHIIYVKSGEKDVSRRQIHIISPYIHICKIWIGGCEKQEAGGGSISYIHINIYPYIIYAKSG